MHAVWYEKSSHRNQSVLIGTLGLVVPADPSISVFDLQCTRCEPYCPEPALFATHEVTHLSAYKWPVTIGMVSDHHLVPDFHMLEVIDQHDLEVFEFTDVRRECFGLRQGGKQTARGVGSGLSLRWRQAELATCLKSPKCMQATGLLRLTAMVKKAEMLTNLLCEVAPMTYVAGT